MAPFFDLRHRFHEARQKRRTSRDEAHQKELDLKYIQARERSGKFSTSHMMCYECQTSHDKSCFTFKYDGWGRKTRVCLVSHLRLWIAPGVTAGFSDVDELRNSLLAKESREVECATGSQYWSRWALDSEGHLILSTHISLGLFTSLGNLSQALISFGLYPVCKHREMHTHAYSICADPPLACRFEKSDAGSKASERKYPFEVAQILSECPCHVRQKGLHRPWRCVTPKDDSCEICTEKVRKESNGKKESQQEEGEPPLGKLCPQQELCGSQFSLLLYRRDKKDEENDIRRVALHIQRDFGNYQSLTAETWIQELLESGSRRVTIRFRRDFGISRSLTAAERINRLLEPQDHHELSADWAKGERFVELSSAIEERRLRSGKPWSCDPFEYLPGVEVKASLHVTKNAEYGPLYSRNPLPPARNRASLAIAQNSPAGRGTFQERQKSHALPIPQPTFNVESANSTILAPPFAPHKPLPTLSLSTRSSSSEEGAKEPVDPPSPPTTRSSINSVTGDAAKLSLPKDTTKQIPKPNHFRRSCARLKRLIQQTPSKTKCRL